MILQIIAQRKGPIILINLFVSKFEEREIEQTFTCLKSAIEILEKGQKYVQS